MKTSELSFFDGKSWLAVQPSTYKGGSHMLVRMGSDGAVVPLMLGSLGEMSARVRRRAKLSA